MASRSPPQWLDLFLAALRETGNVRWSAQQAGVDPTSVYNRRNRDPDFAEAWARALEERERGYREWAAVPELAGRRGKPVPSQELIERLSSRHGPQLVRTGAGRWCKGAEDRFLAAMAATANVKRAAASAGFSDTALYRRRLKNRQFAEAWDAALAIGRTRLEAYLIECADRTFDPDSLPVDGEALPKMTVAEAIATLRLLGKSGGRACGGESGSGWGRGWIGDPSWDDPDEQAEVDQAREAIIGRIGRLREQMDEEKLAAGWTKVGEDWVPPGWAPVVEARALPAGEEGAERGPSVRAL